MQLINICFIKNHLGTLLITLKCEGNSEFLNCTADVQQRSSVTGCSTVATVKTISEENFFLNPFSATPVKETITVSRAENYLQLTRLLSISLSRFCIAFDLPINNGNKVAEFSEPIR